MEVSKMCVATVITLGIMILTILFGFLVGKINGDTDNEWLLYPWMLTSLGFGICLTIVLYTYGIIT